MQSDTISIGLGFLEGLGLILSPCILPIIPIFLVGVLSGSRKRAVGIMIGFSLFFAVVIYFSRQLVFYSGISFDLIRNISYIILVVIGIIMLSSYLSEQFSRLTQRLSQAGNSVSQNNAKGGFLNGLLFGCLIAIIWTPCAGPIIAAIIVQTATQKETITGFITLIAFALGAVLPLFLIAYYGSKLAKPMQFLQSKSGVIRKVLGATLIASVVYLVYFANTSTSTVVTNPSAQSGASLISDLSSPYKAPSIEGIDAWINSKPLSMDDLKGKVVLVDFWAYSCINCIRTFPYLKSWYAKYRAEGFEIVGIHTPEFDFEKKLENVQNAVKRNGILYPVALDNQFKTWNNFSNHFWPAHYLINKQGEVVYTHFGEGHYDVTENNIRFLLGMKAIENKVSQPLVEEDNGQTPETYLGFSRAESRFSPSLIHNKDALYQYKEPLIVNAWGLDGAWKVEEQLIRSVQPNASLKLHFKAKQVYMVMGNSSNKPIEVKVLLNGKPIAQGAGKDVHEGKIMVDGYALYEVVSLPVFGESFVELVASAPGLTVYTFTFGGS